MHIKSKIITSVGVASLLALTFPAQAHNNDCHKRHSCPSDTGTYSCGDLGYSCDFPAHTSPSGSVLGTFTEVSNYILTYSEDIPALVNEEFNQIFGRAPNNDESWYWKDRIRIGVAGKDGLRSTIDTRTDLRAAMGWHENHGSTGPTQVAGVQNEDITSSINSIFRSVYDRNPTPSENVYWLSRIADKNTKQQMQGAMQFHIEQGIIH